MTITSEKLSKLQNFLDVELTKAQLIVEAKESIDALRGLVGYSEELKKSISTDKASASEAKKEAEKAKVAVKTAEAKAAATVEAAELKAAKNEAEAKATADKILSDANAQAETIKRDAESLKAEQKAALALKAETDRVRKELEAEQGKLDKIKADLLKIMNVGGN